MASTVCMCMLYVEHYLIHHTFIRNWVISFMCHTGKYIVCTTFLKVMDFSHLLMKFTHQLQLLYQYIHCHGETPIPVWSMPYTRRNSILMYRITCQIKWGNQKVHGRHNLANSELICYASPEKRHAWVMICSRGVKKLMLKVETLVVYDLWITYNYRQRYQEWYYTFCISMA